MPLTRIIDRTPTGNPLFCLLELWSDDLLIASKRTVYALDTSDEAILKMFEKRIPKGVKPNKLKIKVLIEWINNEAINYEKQD